jgi:fused signal recognition particle receptor
MRLLKGLFSKVDQLLTGRKPVDEELFEELEELLIQADLSIHTTNRLMKSLRDAAYNNRLNESDQVKDHLKTCIVEILDQGNVPLAIPKEGSPIVILLVGVNGVGKTTTIAKLANKFKKSGYSVILAAADTFRAAAIEQLDIWAERAGVEMIRHQHGSDPSAVIFDAIQSAKARKIDVVIADTAGRLHTKTNLMDELSKIGRTVNKALGRPSDENLLVLDSTTGQNAVIQAKEFTSAVPLTGIVLTKLDGTAKGGVVITIKDELGLPIKIATTGEKLEDIEDFDAKAFTDALFE